MQASAAVQRVPDGKLLSTSAAQDSGAMHKSTGVHNGMTTLSHALMGIDGPGTMPVSGSMPLSHSILLTGFKSTVMSMAAPAMVPESDADGASDAMEVAGGALGAGAAPPKASERRVPPLPSLGAPPSAENSRTMQGMLFGPLSSKKERLAAGSRERRGGAQGAVMHSPRGPPLAPAGSSSALGKILSLHKRVQNSASGVLRTMGREKENSKQLSTSDKQTSDSDSTTELGKQAQRNRAARAQHHPVGVAAAAAAEEQHAMSSSPDMPVPGEARGKKHRKDQRSVKKQAREIEARSSGTPPPALHRPPIPSPRTRAQENKPTAGIITASPSAPLATSPRVLEVAQSVSPSAMATVPPSIPQQRAAVDASHRNSPKAVKRPSPPPLQLPTVPSATNACAPAPEHSPRTFDDSAVAVLATPQPSPQMMAAGMSDRLFSDQSSFTMGGAEASVMSRTGSVTFDCRNDMIIGGTMSVTQSSLMQGESSFSANAPLPPMEGGTTHVQAAAAAAGGEQPRRAEGGGSLLWGAETLSTQFTGWSVMHEQSTMQEGRGLKANTGSSTLQDAPKNGRETPQESFVSAMDASPLTPTDGPPYPFGTGSFSSYMAEDSGMQAAPAVMVTRKRLQAVNEHQSVRHSAMGMNGNVLGKAHHAHHAHASPTAASQQRSPRPDRVGSGGAASDPGRGQTDATTQVQAKRTLSTQHQRSPR